MKGEINIRNFIARKMLYPQNFFPDFHISGRESLADLTAYHMLNQFLSRGFFCIHRCNVFSIAKHRTAICQFENLFHSMGYIDNGNSLCFQLPNGFKQNFYFRIGQCRRGLVHNQNTHVSGNRFRDFHKLHISDA